MSGLFLVAQVADRWVAISADQVESVVDIAAIVPVPRATSAVRGLAALRSRVVTVIDPRIALGLPAGGGAGRAVIACMDGHHYAFLVDALDDVAPFERLDHAAGGGGGWDGVTGGLVVRDGVPLLIVDLAALIPGAAPMAA